MSTSPPDSELELQPLVIRQSSFNDLRRSFDSVRALEHDNLLVDESADPYLGREISGGESVGNEADAEGNEVENGRQNNERPKNDNSFRGTNSQQSSENDMEDNITGEHPPHKHATMQAPESGYGNTLATPISLEVASEVGHQESTKQATKVGPTWRPTWLRFQVLAAFTVLFLVMTIVILLLLLFSKGNNGLCEIRQDFAYVWRFGPTIVFTILAALWERVQLQAMKYMPAIAISTQKECGKDIYTLDYMSMLSPMVLVRSIRRKHHLVYITLLISLLLKAQVALSPGLFSPIDVRVEKKTDVIVLDSFDVTAAFSDGKGGLGWGDPSSYYIPRAVQDFHMLYPFGVSKNVAYQTFEMSRPNIDNPRGTIDAPIEIIVEGFFAEPYCRKLKRYVSAVNMTLVDDPKGNNVKFEYELDLYFEDCEGPIRLKPVGGSRPYILNSIWDFRILRRPEEKCSTLPNQSNLHFTYFAGLLNISSENTSNVEFSTAAAIVCSPVAWLEQVAVFDDGIIPNITPVPNASRNMLATDVYAFMQSSFPPACPFFGSQDELLGPLAMDRDNGISLDLMDPSIYDEEVLINSTMNLFQAMSPFIGHYSLRQPGNQTTTGLVNLSSKRLSINQKAGGPMTAVFAVVTLASIIILLIYGRTNQPAVWNRNPTTILGNMAFLRQYAGFADQVEIQSGNMNNQHAKANWSDCSFSPLVLRPWARAVIIIYVLSLLACLISTQRWSDSSQGLATLSTDKDINMDLLWTSGPSLILLSVSLYATSCAMALRALYVFWLPMSRACNTTQLDKSLLDMLSIRALYQSISLKSLPITLFQVLSFACAVLTTLASVLFTPEEITPIPQSVALQKVTRLSTRPLSSIKDPAKTRRTLSSLLLRQGDANFTYPRNTYRDLVFPDLDYAEISQDVASVTLNNIPAAQLQSQCSRLPLDSNDTSDFSLNAFNMDFPVICSNGTRFIGDYNFYNPLRASIFDDDEIYECAYIGRSIPPSMAANFMDPECQPGRDQKSLDTLTSATQTYVWGTYSQGDRNFSSLFVWQCTYEWFQVSTEASLIMIDGQWAIDPTNPPRPDYSTLQQWKPALGIPTPYYSLPEEPRDVFASAFPAAVFTENRTMQLLNDEVALLVQPYGSFPPEALGDAEQNEAILAGLRYNFGFVAAQLANVEYRINVDDRSDANDVPDLSPIKATLNYKPQRRLVQNAGPTYTIATILSAVALANIWSLCSKFVRRDKRSSMLFDMDVKGLAPEGFCSFAAMLSLVRDSNVYAHLPRNIKSLSNQELHNMLSHLSFRMGWFQNTKNSNKHFTIGVLEDHETIFLGGKQEVQENGDKRDNT